MRGTLPASPPRPKVVSIVGSRRCTKYGEDLAYRVAYELASMGVIIVSGLAYGIDSWAHRGCLDAGGTTVAILGTPIDYIYPVSNTNLAKRILERGAILSEYPPGYETRSWHFLKRNRIVAGLCDVLLIVEASDHSGTLTTASMALDAGKDIFVVPGDLTRPMSVGCNRMLRDGANIFTETDDILRVIMPEKVKSKCRRMPKLNEIERGIYEEINAGNCDGDAIIASLGISVADFNQSITTLELKDLILSLGANKWAIIN